MRQQQRHYIDLIGKNPYTYIMHNVKTLTFSTDNFQRGLHNHTT